MKILRVFNNNAVAVLTDDDKDAVLIGSGVGFNKKANEETDFKKVDKIYYVQSELQTKFLDLLNGTKEEYFVAAEAILKHAEDLGLTITAPVIMALTEHISFAIQRKREGLRTPNLMLNEIQSFYPQEYIIGEWGVQYIHKFMGVNLGDSEAGYIALHIINSALRLDSKQTVDTLQFVKGTMQCIEDSYSIQIDTNSFDTNRLITHLKFLAQRFLSNKKIESQDNPDIYDYILEKNPQHYIFIQNYQKYVKSQFGYELGKQELMYVLIHVTKFISR